MDAQDSVPSHVVAVAVFLTPTRAMRKKEFRQAGVAPEDGEVQRGCFPVAAQRVAMGQPSATINSHRGARSPHATVSGNSRSCAGRREPGKIRADAAWMRRASAASPPRASGDKFLLLGQRLRGAGGSQEYPPPPACPPAGARSIGADAGRTCARDGSAPAANIAWMWRGERRSATPRSSGAPQSLVGGPPERLVGIAPMSQQQFERGGVRHVQGTVQGVGSGYMRAARQQQSRAVKIFQRVMQQLAIVRIGPGVEQQLRQRGIAIDDSGRPIKGGRRRFFIRLLHRRRREAIADRLVRIGPGLQQELRALR